ncbi:syndetin-like [Saccoglossus kowalevskii]
MALRKKIRSLLPGSKQRSSSLDDDQSSPGYEPIYKYKEEDREFARDPLEQAELISSIEDVYFSDDSFDSSRYELKKLDSTQPIDLDKMDEDRDVLRKQLQAVSKKVSDLVLENQSAYVKELQRVMELQTNLQTANVICANGRRQLSLAKKDFTVASLSILSNHRKRLQLVSLMRSLHTIKTLQRTDIRLREMMEEEDYPGAIQLCLECQKAASTFKHFTCISELNSKLQDTLEMIEEQLDQALAKTCLNFDTHHYNKVQTAYRLLGKTQTAMDQLHMHFTSAIHNTAFTIVLGYVELCAGSDNTNFQKMPYRDLCGHITVDTYIPCLVNLCKALWEVMMSYHKTIDWHERFDPAAQQVSSTPDTESGFICAFQKESSGRVLGSKLTTTLKRIEDNLIQQSVVPGPSQLGAPNTDEKNTKVKFPYPHLSPVVEMTDLNKLFGLSERMVATESLLFLSEQFQFLQSHLESMIPPSKKPFLQQFYSQTVIVAHELRIPVYRSVATKAIDFEQMIQMMTNVRWDIKEIMSQHNPYVDWLLQELQLFDLRIQEVARKVPLPQPVYYILWEHVIRLSNWTFVEGFACAKKCSNEGRALMQLDFQQFLMKLEKLTDIRPIPDREYVETYIKAFYLTENDMEQWIRDHREYSTKQLTSLVTSGVTSLFQKKSRQKLVQVIEEIDRLRR